MGLLAVNCDSCGKEKAKEIENAAKSILNAPFFSAAGDEKFVECLKKKLDPKSDYKVDCEEKRPGKCGHAQVGGNSASIKPGCGGSSLETTLLHEASHSCGQHDPDPYDTTCKVYKGLGGSCGHSDRTDL
jgi:hypothetical protein